MRLSSIVVGSALRDLYRPFHPRSSDLDLPRLGGFRHGQRQLKHAMLELSVVGLRQVSVGLLLSNRTLAPDGENLAGVINVAAFWVDTWRCRLQRPALATGGDRHRW